VLLLFSDQWSKLCTQGNNFMPKFTLDKYNSLLNTIEEMMDMYINDRHDQDVVLMCIHDLRKFQIVFDSEDKKTKNGGEH
jgi:hypothetical protein